RGYSWPGNVRELRNVLQRAVALARRPGDPPVPFEKLVFNLGPAQEAPVTLGLNFPGVTVHLPYKEAKARLVDSFDRAYLEALLARSEGNIRRAAEAAGLSRKHLYALLRRVDMADDDAPEDADADESGEPSG